MKPEGSSPCSQDIWVVRILSYMNPNRTLIFFVLKIHFNIVLPSTSGSSKPHQTFRLNLCEYLPSLLYLLFRVTGYIMFWDVTPCSLIGDYRLSEEPTVSQCRRGRETRNVSDFLPKYKASYPERYALYSASVSAYFATCSFPWPKTALRVRTHTTLNTATPEKVSSLVTARSDRNGVCSQPFSATGFLSQVTAVSAQ
jgi:hypothetical protein